MRPTPREIRFCGGCLIAACSIWLICCGTVLAGEQVVVQLDDGRNSSGEVDARTNETQPWLRTTAPSVVLRSGFEWNHVRRVHLGQRVLSVQEFRPIAQELKSDLPPDFFSGRHSDGSGSPKVTALHEGRTRVAANRVRTLHIEAFVANWDNDVETDGLRVFVYPLDAAGQIVPVNGQLDFKLIGRTQRIATNNRFRRRELFPELGRWSRLVRKADFVGPAAVYEIPFRNFHPEFHLDVAAEALLTARLGIPGRGTFHASDVHVQLRPLSRIRDELRGQEHRRFLPQEVPRRHPL